MKVYVVTWEDFDTFHLIGVFSTKEKADKYIENADPLCEESGEFYRTEQVLDEL